jgi:hypothetical protein
VLRGTRDKETSRTATHTPAGVDSGSESTVADELSVQCM